MVNLRRDQKPPNITAKRPRFQASEMRNTGISRSWRVENNLHNPLFPPPSSGPPLFGFSGLGDARSHADPTGPQCKHGRPAESSREPLPKRPQKETRRSPNRKKTGAHARAISSSFGRESLRGKELCSCPLPPSLGKETGALRHALRHALRWPSARVSNSAVGSRSRVPSGSGRTGAAPEKTRPKESSKKGRGSSQTPKALPRFRP